MIIGIPLVGSKEKNKKLGAVWFLSLKVISNIIFRLCGWGFFPLMKLHGAKPSIPLVIQMFFKDSIKAHAELWLYYRTCNFFLMGYQSFSQQILHGSKENLSKTPLCVVFYLQSKGFSLFWGREEVEIVETGISQGSKLWLLHFKSQLSRPL